MKFKFLFLLFSATTEAQSTSAFMERPSNGRRIRQTRFHTAPSCSWSEIQDLFSDVLSDDAPISIDSVLNPEKPNFSTGHPTLFRERHGWCPYSERVWLTLELLNIPYDTIRIDNTGGPRPSYYGGGTTPQLKWPNGKTQGESLDLMRDLDQDHLLFYSDEQVQHCIRQFRNIFPSRARPSSRAAFLFQSNGDPLWKSVFEETLVKTDELLGSSRGGPFFCGATLTAADIAWAPFLERYRYQLPCLHQGLFPYDISRYPHLTAWYDAMDTQVAPYACRIKGDASSWRKVLSMAGFGNAGMPPDITANMDGMISKEKEMAEKTINNDLWTEYASIRPYCAATCEEEAAMIVTRNRQAIIQDALKRSSDEYWIKQGLPTTEQDMDMALRALAIALIDGQKNADDAMSGDGVGALARFLDERMCVPRDMGAMSAAAIKKLAF